MLKISKLADYATVIMHWLSTHGDEHFSANVISERTGIGAPTVSKVLKLLNDYFYYTSILQESGPKYLSS